MADRLTRSSESVEAICAPTPTEWRAAMGCFPSGVTIVTTWDSEEPVGSTINAFCSVSLEPPLLLVCIAGANPIYGPLQAAGVFGVNFLPENGRPLALRFSREPLTDRFAEAPYRAAPGGAPQLEAAPVFIDCVLENVHAAGTHIIAVGRGRKIEHASAATPLLYHKGQYPTFVPPG